MYQSPSAYGSNSSKKSSCFRRSGPSCNDLYVFFSIIVGIMTIGFGIMEALDYRSGLQKTLNASLLAGACTVAFLNALPCWHHNPVCSNITGIYGLLLIGHAMGQETARWYTVFHDMGFKEYIGSIVVQNVVSRLTIIGFCLSGLALLILAIVHEFTIKHKKLTCLSALTYVIYSTIMAISGMACWALGYPVVLGLEWYPKEMKTQPRIVTGVFRWGSALAVLCCLIRPYGKSGRSGFITMVMVLANVSMLIISASTFAFPVDSDWFEYGPGKSDYIEILGIWIGTTVLVIFSLFANTCLQPTPKYRYSSSETSAESPAPNNPVFVEAADGRTLADSVWV